MIIELAGEPGSGKTSLNTLFMLLEEQYNGQTMMRHCNRCITEFNKDRAPSDRL